MRGSPRFFVLALLAILLATRSARAADTPCSPDVTAWVARAALDTHVAMRAASCWTDGARIELAPDGAEPLSVEIAEGPGDAFRRVAGLRFAPILEVDDFARIDPRRLEAFDLLVAWVTAHEHDVRLGAIVEATPPSRAPWSLIAAFALVVACGFGRRRSARDGLYALVLFAGALALRLLFGLWGPLHVNGKGPLWIAAAISDPSQVSFYGPGYAELFGPIARGASDVVLFAANGVVSALIAPLAFALARVLGVRAPRAAFAAALLALDPVAIRGATSEGYFAIIAALALGASIASVSATRAWARGETARGVGWAVACALLCTQAVRIHPAAWVPAALAPLAAIGIDEAIPVGRRISFVAAVAAIAASVVLVVDGRVVGAVLAHVAAGDLHRPAYSVARIVWVVPPLAIVAMTKPKRAWLVVPAVASVAALLVTRDTYVQSAFWQASFDRLYLAAPVVAVVGLVPDSFARGGGRALAAGALIAELAAYAPAALHAQTTEQLEYRWLRGELAAIPRGCRVDHVARVEKRELFLPTYSSRLSSGVCAYYVHSSLCTSWEGAPVCEAAERGLVLGAADRATFAALPSSRELPYDAPEVEVWIARVDGVKP
jgi:hypothetical protein